MLGCNIQIPFESNHNQISSESTHNQIPPGTTLQGVDVSGLNEDEFEEAREEIIEEWNQRKVNIINLEKRKEIPVAKLGISYRFDHENIFEEAGGYQLDYEIDQDKALQTLEDKFDFVIEEPVNAELVVEEEPQIIEHQPGIRPDPESALEKIKENPFKEGYYLFNTEFFPEVTTQDIEDKGIEEKVGYYHTEYNPGKIGRSTNIEIVAEHVDGSILAPGEEFSFNETAGPYNSARGFQPADVYTPDGVEEGIGGGVCQNSSTLYMAALLAGLEITEHHPHSYTVGYLPLGQDASVSYGVTDLKIKNTLDNHVYIQMNAGGGHLEVTIYGTSEKDVEVYSVVLEEIEPPEEKVETSDLEEGEEEVEESGAYGYRTITYISTNGNESVLREDYYHPREKVIKVPEEKEEDEEEDAEKDKDEDDVEKEEDEEDKDEDDDNDGEEKEEDIEDEEKEGEKDEEEKVEDLEDEEEEVKEEEEKDQNDENNEEKDNDESHKEENDSQED